MRSRRCAAKARTAFLWGIGIFVAVQLGLAANLESIYPEALRPVFEGRAGRLRCSDPNRPLVLMLGSSRTAYGLDAARLERELGSPWRAFNFGTLGAGPVTQVLHLRRLLDEEREPDLLLIEVLPPFLAGQLPQPAEARWLPTSTRLSPDEIALLSRYRFPRRELDRTQALSWTVPVYAHRSALLSRCCPAWLPYPERLDWAWNGDDHGWSAQPDAPTPEQLRERVQIDRKHYAAAFRGFRLPGAPVRALRELLETCRRRGISAALVLMPEGSAFRSWYPPDMQAQLDALLDDLKREFGVPCIDARTWIADEDFFDAHHLRTSGARAFTNRLARDDVIRRVTASAKR
jgi:hypothetical protein